MIHVYAHPGSQPSRTVLWFCALIKLPCEVTYNPETDLATNNPRHQMPVIEHNGLYVPEMPAILAYLAALQNQTNWLPSTLTDRARIDSYLHSHHSLTRMATLKLMAPHVLTVFDEPPFGPPSSTINNEAIQAALADDEKLVNGRALMDEVSRVFSTAYLIKPNAYIGGMEQPSIADLAAYEELAQLAWAGLYDFKQSPDIQDWLRRMSELPHHETLHRFNMSLGNIVDNPLDLSRFGNAIGEGIAGLEEAGLVLNH